MHTCDEWSWWCLTAMICITIRWLFQWQKITCWLAPYNHDVSLFDIVNYDAWSLHCAIRKILRITKLEAPGGNKDCLIICQACELLPEDDVLRTSFHKIDLAWSPAGKEERCQTATAKVASWTSLIIMFTFKSMVLQSLLMLNYSDSRWSRN